MDYENKRTSPRLITIGTRLGDSPPPPDADSKVARWEVVSPAVIQMRPPSSPTQQPPTSARATPTCERELVASTHRNRSATVPLPHAEPDDVESPHPSSDGNRAGPRDVVIIPIGRSQRCAVVPIGGEHPTRDLAIRASYDVVIIGEQGSGRLSLFRTLRKSIGRELGIEDSDEGSSSAAYSVKFDGDASKSFPIKLACSNGPDAIRRITGSFYFGAIVVLVAYPLFETRRESLESRNRAELILEEARPALREDAVVQFVATMVDRMDPRAVENMCADRPFCRDSAVSSLRGIGIESLTRDIMWMVRKSVMDRLSPRHGPTFSVSSPLDSTPRTRCIIS